MKLVSWIRSQHNFAEFHLCTSTFYNDETILFLKKIYLDKVCLWTVEDGYDAVFVACVIVHKLPFDYSLLYYVMLYNSWCHAWGTDAEDAIWAHLFRSGNRRQGGDCVMGLSIILCIKCAILNMCFISCAVCHALAAWGESCLWTVVHCWAKGWGAVGQAPAELWKSGLARFWAVA